MDSLQMYYKNSLLDGLCKEYKGMWQGTHGDLESLAKLAMCQQSIPHVATYAYQGRGLTKDFCKETFKDYINGVVLNDCDGVSGFTYEWHIDNPDTIELKSDVSHLMWSEGSIVVVERTKCPVIYITNRSDVELICGGFNSVKIYLFDESKVTLTDIDVESSVIVYKYSDKCEVVKGKFCLGDVREFNKELRL